MQCEDKAAQEARAALRRLQAHSYEEQPKTKVQPLLDTVVSQYGDERQPITASAAQRCIAHKLGLTPESEPGFTRYGPSFRLRESDVLCPDRGAIGVNEQFPYHVPCPVKHPHLCATKHAAWMPLLEGIASSLREYLRDKPLGSFLYVRVLLEATAAATFVSLCYKRFRPAIMLFCLCHQDQAGHVGLDLEDGIEGVEFVSDLTLLARILGIDTSMAAQPTDVKEARHVALPPTTPHILM
eukprot:6492403-Amphidinium_carterae.3